jgi:hypothetical protein
MGVKVRCINCVYFKADTYRTKVYKTTISTCPLETGIQLSVYERWCSHYKPSFEYTMKEIIKKHEEETNEKK